MNNNNMERSNKDPHGKIKEGELIFNRFSNNLYLVNSSLHTRFLSFRRYKFFQKYRFKFREFNRFLIKSANQKKINQEFYF